MNKYQNNERIKDLIECKGVEYWTEGYWERDEIYLLDMGIDIDKVKKFCEMYLYIMQFSEEIAE